MAMKTPLVDVPEYGESPRCIEDQGKLSPTSEAARKSGVAKAFPIGKAASEGGTAVSGSGSSVSLSDGQMSPNAKTGDPSGGGKSGKLAPLKGASVRESVSFDTGQITPDIKTNPQN